ncbi:TagK domain-containing protein [Caballeronia sp. GAFFF1]|uniref:TagK domain-containing protein n=1 Tax=Caballeronia sp. GAFFF1 TaxID=2921779 RepID=UPI002028A114|nr:TagK domain-containing protein [Caballeronia sp. GAFFF1]
MEPQGQPVSGVGSGSVQRAGQRDHGDTSHATSPYGENAVLDLLGGAADSSSARFIVKAADDAGSSAGDRLMGSLYEQYCQALDSPLASLPDTWVDAASGEGMPLRDQELASHRWRDQAVGPVAAILGDISNLEQAFGPMHHIGPYAAASVEEVPEVLRLFAPPEYHAASARRPSPILPSLVRREHHTLAIDSPVRPLNTPHEREQKETL